MSPFLELRGVPINCSASWRSAAEARNAPKGDLVLGFCTGCGMIRNLAFDPAILSYAEGYENSLYASPTFREFARELAEGLVERHDLRGRSLVEIGSGGGEFLRLLCSLGGNRGVGYDPSGAHPDQETPDVRFLGGVFPEVWSGEPVDFVCCRHVLEHVDDPRALLACVRRALGARAGARVYFEVPDADCVLRGESMWDLIYPHCSYFAAPALERLFEEEGFRVLRLEAVFGGQFLALEAEPATGASPARPPRSGDLAALALRVEAFATTFRARVAESAERLAGAEQSGRRVALWGAGAKGVTFLNVVAGGAGIDAVVDLNPRKQGTFVPGTGQLVIAPGALTERPPDEVWILNPLYRREIESQLRELGVRADVRVV